MASCRDSWSTIASTRSAPPTESRSWRRSCPRRRRATMSVDLQIDLPSGDVCGAPRVRPGDHAVDPARRRCRPRAVDRRPGARRGAHHRRLHRLVPGRTRRLRDPRRDTHRRQLPGPDPGAGAGRRARGSCAAPSGAWAGPTSMRPRSCGESTSSWGTPTAPYDFRRLAPFVDAFREGYEFVMGSRWKGSIERAPCLRTTSTSARP